MNKNVIIAAACLTLSAPTWALDCAAFSEWQASTAYNSGAKTQYLNKAYQANWWTQGNDPASHSGQWQEWRYLGDCDGAGGTLPVVSITSPVAGGSFSEGSVITLAAQASDADNAITQVSFSVNGSSVAVVQSPPYQTDWVATLGQATIEAQVTNAAGATAIDSVTINVTAGGDNQPPTAQITSPVAGSQVVEGATVLLAAEAADSDGFVSAVDFYLNDINVGQVTSAPYQLNWTATAGQQTLAVVATDDVGAQTRSADVGFTVAASGGGAGCADLPTYVAGTTYQANQEVQLANQRYRCDVAGWCSSSSEWAYAPGTGLYWQDAWTGLGLCTLAPEVSITSPQAGDVLLAGSSVIVSANASDDGSVTEVAFSANGSALGAVSTAPYQVTWTPSTLGDVVIAAVATDDEGNQSTASQTVTVTDQDLVVNLTSPSSGTAVALGKSLTIAADAAALSNPLQRVDFLVNGAVVGSDSSAPYQFVWTPAAAGRYTVSAQVFDTAGSSALSSAASVSVQEVVGKRHKLIGYWHNFVNGAGCPMNLSEMSTAWDVIDIAFADNDRNSNGTVHFNLYNGDIHSSCAPIDPVRFKQDLKALQAQGKIFVLSLGGAEGTITLNTDADQTNFVASLTDIINEWGFDGLDIDLESGSNLLHGSQIQARLPVALRQIQTNLGRDMYLTMAPEHPYVQGGMIAYSGIWGAYIPVIDQVRDMLDLLHVQLYNNGGLANPYMTGAAPEGSVDMMVASVKMLVEGFEKGDGQWFAPLRDDQVAIGLPSGPSSANSGQAPTANIVAALDCLTRLQSCGSVVPATTYPNFGGVMTWSINWDEHDGFNFSGPIGDKLTQMNGR